jgi:hypothetical protein
MAHAIGVEGVRQIEDRQSDQQRKEFPHPPGGSVCNPKNICTMAAVTLVLLCHGFTPTHHRVMPSSALGFRALDHAPLAFARLAPPPRCAVVASDGTVDAETLRESRAFGAASWFAWWSQLILSVVSTVTLVFANAVRTGTNPLLSGLLLSGCGVATGFASTFWMWGYKGFSKRLLRKDVDPDQLATQARRSLRLGITLNLAGMAVTLFSAEQIIGLLAAKSLTLGLNPIASNGQFISGLASAVQPIDLLILQANTNTLLSHYIGLCTSLWLRQRRFVSAAPK